MLSQWPIRNKLLFGIGLLLVIVAALSWSGFHGVYAYRALVRSLYVRADELPLAQDLSRQVADMRVLLAASDSASDGAELESRFAAGLNAAQSTTADYVRQLQQQARTSVIHTTRDEQLVAAEIQVTLARLASSTNRDSWPSDAARLQAVRGDLDELQALSWELPSFLQKRIHDVKDEVRLQYRGLIGLSWITTVLAMVLLGLFIRLFYAWIVRPLRVLVHGSRRVAAGEFSHRIALDTHDEISELADAMNAMTARFEAIRDDLDRQVRERTKQVVRSEQLASVGFLAAGVAHEINNPLASIALCAESLEGRIGDVLDQAPSVQEGDSAVIRNYLRMIQNEAFRCKGITERLLDFSRKGDLARHDTELRELVQGVIDMVAHLGSYQDKRIEFAAGRMVVAPVNSQELKQVVLNLITNALDSLSPGGLLTINVAMRGEFAELSFTDNGCGMTEEVQKHLFEPFFTRRRNGQGTGLGLSITYRIVADHGGQIDVHSDGPGRGSRFRVLLPLVEQKPAQPANQHTDTLTFDAHKEKDHRHQAA